MNAEKRLSRSLTKASTGTSKCVAFFLFKKLTATRKLLIYKVEVAYSGSGSILSY